MEKEKWWDSYVNGKGLDRTTPPSLVFNLVVSSHIVPLSYATF